MKNNILFRGILPALVTPIDSEHRVKEAETRKLVEWELSHCVNGFYLCGSTGEGLILPAKTRKDLLEIVLDEVKGRVPVITHVGAIDVPTTLDLARHAKAAGAAAVSSIPPIYFQYSTEDVLAYYRELAEAAEIPLLMYGIGLAGTKLTVSIVEELMKIENVIGIKWTYPDFFAMGQLKELNGGNINVINGPDEMLVCGLAIGADAGIGTTYNVMPGLFVSLYRAYQSGDVAEARRLQAGINRVIAVLIKYQAIASTKALLTDMGFDVGQCAKPIHQFDDAERKAFLAEVSGFVDFEKQVIL